MSKASDIKHRADITRLETRIKKARQTIEIWVAEGKLTLDDGTRALLKFLE